jgi:hypothetical protein
MTAFTGLLGAPIENMQTLVGACESFQTFCGVSGAAAGKTRVYAVIESEDDVTRPMALLTYQDGDYSLSRDAAGAGSECFARTSSLLLVFQQDVNDYAQETVKTFLNSISAIIAEMLTLSGTESYMLINDLVYRQIHQADDGEEKRLYSVWSVGWGM